jgi:site-specific recombinase XerD
MNDPQLRLRLRFCPETPSGLSPYRLYRGTEEEIAEVNGFLDAQATRGLSPRSLRTYGYSLLNFWRWFESVETELSELRHQDVFLDYVRFQRSSEVEPAATTINHRLTAVCCLYQFHFHCDLAQPSAARSHPYHSSVAAPSGYLYPARRRARRWRVKSPRRVIVPLTDTEVRVFLESFSTWRDLAIVALMLLCGLRSREVIELHLMDLDFDEPQIRVCGKGDKERTVPLPSEVVHFLRRYLELERPRNADDTLLVSLKGKKRGQAMTPAGLRSLFRHHRRVTRIEKANPHRLRHTFASKLAGAGISLPALMELMGHADIKSTMRYVQLSPRDVWREFQRVLKIRSDEKKVDES